MATGRDTAQGWGDGVTTIDEEMRALIYARDFLFSLLDPKQTPRVPSKVRAHARMVLRHYPYPVMIRERYEDFVETARW